MVNVPSSFVSRSSCGASSIRGPREQPGHGKWFESHPQSRACRLSLSLTEALKRWRGALPGSQTLHIPWFLSRHKQDRAALCPCVFGAVACPATVLLWAEAPGVCLGGAHTEDHRCGEMGQSSIPSKCVWQSSVCLDTGWSPFVHLWVPCVLGCLPSSLFCSLLANQEIPVF